MSTNRSVGRTTATQEKDRPGVPTQQNIRSAVKPKVGRFTATSKKDRSNLCTFTFADGRRCRTPRMGKHPRFCFYHAQKEARARAAQKLGKDMTYFFSGEYLSACDLSTALGRLIPGVIRGDLKPRTARTVAYMAQTLLQAIHLSQHEYGEAFGGDGWRKAIRKSVNHNHDYLFPPAPKPKPPSVQAPNGVAGLETGQGETPQAPQPAQTPLNCHSHAGAQAFRPQECASSSSSSLSCPPWRASRHPFTPSEAEGPLPQPLPSTAAEFAQQVLAGRNSSRPEVPTPSGSEIPTPSGSEIPTPSGPARETATPSSPSVPLTLTGAASPAPPQTQAQQPAPQPACPQQARRVNPREPNRDAPWLHWSPTSDIPPDSHLL